MIKHHVIDAGLKILAATRVHRLLAPLTRGRGAVLMFHHVRPARSQAFAPNRGLAITPAFLDAVLATAKAAGYRIVPLDEVLPRLASPASERFVALTFDDGYRDNLDHALPVLERHGAHATIFVTTGFADRTARLWWLDLESLVRKAAVLEGTLDGRPTRFAVGTSADKTRTFSQLADMLMRRPAAEAAAAVDALGGDEAEGRARVGTLCLDWPAVTRLGTHPLVTIGCHTLTHSCLAALDPTALDRELRQARNDIEARIGRPVAHFAYPYGSPRAAGPREFAAAAAAGFRTAVTTRPGVLHDADVSGPMALPRLSVNGRWQTSGAFAALLSGLPFAFWNLGRRR